MHEGPSFESGEENRFPGDEREKPSEARTGIEKKSEIEFPVRNSFRGTNPSKLMAEIGAVCQINIAPNWP